MATPTWTTPQTWSTGQVDHTDLNTDLRDNVDNVGSPGMAAAFDYSTVGLSDGVADTPDAAEDEFYDTDAIHFVGSNPGRLTIPSGMGGMWRCHAQIDLYGSGGVVGVVGAGRLRILEGASNEISDMRIPLIPTSSGESSPISTLSLTTPPWPMGAGDYFKAEVTGVFLTYSSMGYSSFTLSAWQVGRTEL